MDQIARLNTLGKERTEFPILSHTVPPSASSDGLLGLDFLRRAKVDDDFRQADVSLS